MKTTLRAGMRPRRTLSTVSLLAFGVAAMATPVFAQETPAVEEPLESDVIVVTAQKREQDIQDVPISMSAIGADKLEAQGITNLENLSNYVPGVQIGKGAIYTPVNIRGIGSIGS